MRNSFYVITGWLFLVAILVVTVSIRFMSPELTETQLFIKYWYVWLACIPAAVLAVKLVDKK